MGKLMLMLCCGWWLDVIACLGWAGLVRLCGGPVGQGFARTPGAFGVKTTLGTTRYGRCEGEGTLCCSYIVPISSFITKLGLFALCRDYLIFFINSKASTNSAQPLQFSSRSSSAAKREPANCSFDGPKGGTTSKVKHSLSRSSWNGHLALTQIAATAMRCSLDSPSMSGRDGRQTDPCCGGFSGEVNVSR
jgi:hypothetical protein